MQNRLKLSDILVIMTAAAFTFFTAYTAYIKPEGQSQVFIRAQEGEWVYPVDAHERVIVKGPLGETIIRFQENGAWIDSSPCDNKTCVAAGKIYKHGQWAACLPNNVILMIHSAGDNDVDSVAW